MKQNSHAHASGGTEPPVLVSQSIANFEKWWPRSDRLGDARCYAFQCADILEVWLATVGKANGIEPYFACVFAPSGKPALLVPFGTRRHHGATVLEFLDQGYSDYNAPVVFPDTAFHADAAQIWTALTRSLPEFDLAILEKMPNSVGDLPNPLSPLAQFPHYESCHVVGLHAPWESFGRERIKHLSDSARRRRKLDKLGTVKISVAETAEERIRFLAAMMRMKSRKFIETRGFDTFTLPGVAAFYKETTARLGEGGTVQLSALTLDDQILAAHWGYVVGNRFYHLMPAYEAGEWRAYAPGRLLNEWLLQWAVERGLEYFDFGIGDEPYKFDYCDLHIPLGDAYLPQTLRGRILSAALRARSTTRDHLQRTQFGRALVDARRRWRSGGAPRVIDGGRS